MSSSCTTHIEEAEATCLGFFRSPYPGHHRATVTEFPRSKLKLRMLWNRLHWHGRGRQGRVPVPVRPTAAVETAQAQRRRWERPQFGSAHLIATVARCTPTFRNATSSVRQTASQST